MSTWYVEILPLFLATGGIEMQPSHLDLSSSRCVSQLAGNGATVSSSSEDLGKQTLMRSEQHNFLGKPEGAVWQVLVWCGYLRVAVLGQAEGRPSCAKAWWQLPGEGPKKGRARVKYSFAGVPNPSSEQQCSAQIPSPNLGSFCFALCVNLLVWLGTSLPAPCLSFPTWGEGLV